MTIAELLAHDTTLYHQRLILTRWIGGALLIGATFFGIEVLSLSLQAVPLYLLGITILLYNGILAYIDKRSVRQSSANNVIDTTQRLILIQIGLDWAALAIFINLSGGITSPALVFFVLHVIMVTILFSGQTSYLYTGLVVLTVLGIALGEAVGILPHQNVIPRLPDDLYQQSRYILAEFAFFSLGVITVALLTNSIMAPLRRREQQLTALFQTTQAVSSTLDLNDVLSHLGESAKGSLAAKGVTIRLLDKGKRNLELVAQHGAGFFSQQSIPVDPNSPHEAALAGQVMEVDQYNMVNFPEELIRLNTRQVLLIPILGERPLGLLSIYFQMPIRVTDEIRGFARAIADQGATAIENALAHDALRQAEKQRSQFVHVLTHELRSPVVGSQSLLRALLKSKAAAQFTDQQRDILTRLSKRMDALLQLINDLLSLAATKAQDLQEPLQAVNISEILSNLSDEYRYQAAEKSLTLQTDLPDETVTVFATQTGVQRILDNLIGNAVKYTPEGGEVTVCLSAEGKVTIQDTGIGIPKDNLDQLGEEFFRASNARKSDITGTGLGIATVKQLVDHFGGDFGVESQENVGTTFTIRLPLVEPDRAA